MIRGFCPGVFDPMPSGDGLLVRVKPRAGRLTAASLRRIADAAQRHGNGVIGLTSRANLQIRGLTERSADRFAIEMVAAGLAAADPAIERRRNIVADPFSESDTASALERLLAADARLALLPPKFGFAVDGAGVRADIRIDAGRVGIDGATATAIGGAEAAVQLARAFLDLASSFTDPPRRMRALVERIGAAAIFAAAGLAQVDHRHCEVAWPKQSRGLATNVTGYHAGPPACFGAALPFGQTGATSLVMLADLAQYLGDGLVRMTAQRRFLLGGIAARASGTIRAALARHLIVDAADPRLSVTACPGRRGCASGTVDTRGDAVRLAALGLPGPIHLSGCAKGCAHPAQAPITLVGAHGRYGIVRDGCASDAPSEENLSLGDVARILGKAA